MGKFVSERGFGKIALIAPNYAGGRETLDAVRHDNKWPEVYYVAKGAY